MTRRPKADLNREADRQKYYGWAGWKFGHRGFSAFVYFSSNQKSDVGVGTLTKLKLFTVKRKKNRMIFWLTKLSVWWIESPTKHTEKMTQFLPPNLLALFAPRDPIPYLQPPDKLPHEKKNVHNYHGMAMFVANNFENPADTPPPTKVEMREER